MQNEALYHWAALSPDAQHWECCLSPWYTCYQHINVECGCHSMCTEWILFFLNPHPRTCSLILERGEGREREEKPRYEREPLVTSHTCPDWVLFLYADSFSMHPEDQTRNLGMCPDQESNPRPFSVWDYAPTNWATPARNSFFKKKRFYLFIFRKMGREGEKHWCVRDTSTGCLSHTPNQGPGLQPRHVHWLGIEPATLWFSGWCSIHWVTPARAEWVLYAMTGAHVVVWIFTSTSVILNWYSEHKGKHVLLVASC